jgi:hypothetical protein
MRSSAARVNISLVVFHKRLEVEQYVQSLQGARLSQSLTQNAGKGRGR